MVYISTARNYCWTFVDHILLETGRTGRCLNWAEITTRLSSSRHWWLWFIPIPFHPSQHLQSIRSFPILSQTHFQCLIIWQTSEKPIYHFCTITLFGKLTSKIINDVGVTPSPIAEISLEARIMATANVTALLCTRLKWVIRLRHHSITFVFSSIWWGTWLCVNSYLEFSHWQYFVFFTESTIVTNDIAISSIAGGLIPYRWYFHYFNILIYKL